MAIFLRSWVVSLNSDTPIKDIQDFNGYLPRLKGAKYLTTVHYILSYFIELYLVLPLLTHFSLENMYIV